MLLSAGMLTVVVALMHSVLGGRHLINPITRRTDLPVILGSASHTRRTLHFGWHLLSLNWIGMAGLMMLMHFRPELKSPPFLVMTAGLFAVFGLISLVYSRGRHPAWWVFLPASALLALSALG
ncbi:MAG: hypothetical protein AAGA23_11900 [Pseudomonadota bacterium]